MSPESELLAYLENKSLRIVRNRCIGSVVMLIVVFIPIIAMLSYNGVTHWVTYAVFGALLVVPLIYVTVMNLLNVKHLSPHYRKFNAVVYGTFTKLLVIYTFVQTIINVLSLLNPFRGIDRNARSAGSVLIDSALDVGVQIPAYYASMSAAELVEEYYRKR